MRRATRELLALAGSLLGCERLDEVSDEADEAVIVGDAPRRWMCLLAFIGVLRETCSERENVARWFASGCRGGSSQ